jgi:hypothetical protein
MTVTYREVTSAIIKKVCGDADLVLYLFQKKNLHIDRSGEICPGVDLSAPVGMTVTHREVTSIGRCLNDRKSAFLPPLYKFFLHQTPEQFSHFFKIVEVIFCFRNVVANFNRESFIW